MSFHSTLWRELFDDHNNAIIYCTIAVYPSSYCLSSIFYSLLSRQCGGAAAVCQQKEVVKMQLEVVSLGPRAFIVDRFLSDFEAEEIVRLASPGMATSQVGEE